MQTRTGKDWTTRILPGSQSSYLLSNEVESVAVSAVNRYQKQGLPAVVELGED